MLKSGSPTFTDMINLIWKMQQQRDIASAQGAAAQAKSDLGRANLNIRGLEDTVEEISAITQALCELVQARLGITDAELLAKMDEIKHREVSKAQNAPAAPAACCSKCARPLGAKVARCLYCGTPVPKTEVFG